MPEKVAILGGGLGALAAALELTAPALGGRFDVTVYTQGHRLGGKCASSRNPAAHNRNEEHGLHVWFGCYENAFALLDQVYRDHPGVPPFPTIWDAFIARDLTVLGSGPLTSADRWEVTFPVLPNSKPGDGTPIRDPRDTVAMLGGVIHDTLISAFDLGISSSGPVARSALRIAKAEFMLVAGLAKLVDGVQTVEGVARVTNAVGGFRALDQLGDYVSAALRAIFRLIPGPDPKLRQLLQAADVLMAVVNGLLDPTDAPLERDDLDVLDKYEFRDWLLAHGAELDSVNSSFVRAVYECMFAYDGGDRATPTYAAGVAVRVVLRIGCTYKGHVLYLPKSGFGEAIIAPIYRVLVARGVKFEFFRRVTQIVPDAAGTSIARVEFSRQADVAAPPYRPLLTVSGLDCWPVQPDWSQLSNGAILGAVPGIDLESYWCAQSVGTHTLRKGVDFDRLVLGIPSTALKEICAPITAISRRWAAMIDGLKPVPNISMQLWMDRNVSQLGPWAIAPALDAGPLPYDVWTDMSETLATESWPAANPPRSVQYLCGVIKTDLHLRPASATTTQAEATAQARNAALAFLETEAHAIWPNAYAYGRVFDWDVLHDAAGGVRSARLAAQYIRANVDPSEVTHASIPGATELRFYAGLCEFDNMVCAGDWVRNGLNSAAVESAIMGGRQAGRALIGADYEIPGEYWLSVRPHRLSEIGLPRALPMYVDRIGRGEQAMPAPGKMTRSKLTAFAIRGQQAKMQGMVDRFLNHPANRPGYYVVDSDSVLVTFMDARMSSDAAVVGYLPDRECAIWIPVKHGGRRLFFMPYIVVDTAIAMATGREAWGFHKELGRVTLAADSWRATGTVFEPLAAGTQGIERELAVARRIGAPGPVGTIVSGISAFAGLMAGSVIAELFGVPQPQVVNLKQFRDAELPDRACFQSIVESPFVIDNLISGRILSGTYEVAIANFQSHTIASDLGLPPVSVPTLVAEAEMDFRALLGTEVWRFR